MSSDEKNIGRRAFLGLVLAGIVALFVGKDIFPRITSGGGSSSGGASGFRINTVQAGPPFNEATWRLTVDGLVRNPLNLTFWAFLSQVLSPGSSCREILPESARRRQHRRQLTRKPGRPILGLADSRVLP